MQKDAYSAGKAVKTVEHVILSVLLAVFLLFSVVAIRLVDPHIPSAIVKLCLSLTTLLFTILLYLLCISTFAWGPCRKRLFETLIVLFFLTNLPLLLSSGSEGHPPMRRLTMLLSTLLYLFSSLYWLAFWFFQKGEYPHRFGEKCCEIIYFVFFGCYGLVVLVNHFTGFCFFIEEDGTFVTRSPLLYILTVLWFVIYFVIAMTTRCDLKTKLTLASYSFFPLLSWLLLLHFPHSSFYLSIFSNLGIFFYMIPLYLLFFNVYLESGRLFLQREKDLEESRAKAMALKISPHFISNTMSSIVALCYTNAQQAGDLAAKFARYLRDNYTDMTDETMIPFSEELEHIRNYLAVEQVRFAGLRVEYDVQADRFLLPTLTVQPLVENAVRHGISKRPDASGTVKIASFETGNDYVIRIEDDGVGYHPASEQDGKKHVGIANAKTRLTLLCAGELTIASQPERGTVCEIRIPKGA